MRAFIALIAVSSTLALTACGEKVTDPAAQPTPESSAATPSVADTAFEAKLQTTTDPDQLLMLLDSSGGMAATLKNLKVSDRMAELMKEKFNAAPTAYELYSQYDKYAIRGRAEMAYNDAKRALAAKNVTK